MFRVHERSVTFSQFFFNQVTEVEEREMWIDRLPHIKSKRVMDDEPPKPFLLTSQRPHVVATFP